MLRLRVLVEDYVRNGIDDIRRLINDGVENDVHSEVNRLSVAGGAHREVSSGLVGVLTRHDQDLAAHRGRQGRGIRVVDDAVGDVLVRIVGVGGHTVEVDLLRLRVLVEDHVRNGIDDIRRLINNDVENDVHSEVDRLSVAGGTHGEVSSGLVGVLARHDQDLAAHSGRQGRGIRIVDDAVCDVLIRIVGVGGHTVEVDLLCLRVLVEDHVRNGVDDIRRKIGGSATAIEVIHAEVSRRNHIVATASR